MPTRWRDSTSSQADADSRRDSAATDWRGRRRRQSRTQAARGGGFPGLIGSCIDLTDRKAAAASEKARREAEIAANRYKNALLATLSHHLRTPLGVILGRSE